MQSEPIISPELMKNRFTALDVLRGMTITAMLIVNNPGSWSHMYGPLQHAHFNGITPTDFIFPFFMFIMGFSIFLSMKKYADNPRGAVRKIIDRTLKIFLLGLAINALSMLVFRGFHPETLRILGVLQRLALCYGAAALIALYVKSIPRILLLVFLTLIGYGFILAQGNGYVLDETNIVALVDRAILGEAHMYHGEGFPFDPEGLLSTLPGICHVLLGYIVSRATMSQPSADVDTRRRLNQLLVIGGLMTVAGVVLDALGVPFNKKIWSPSFVFVTCGAATLFLALFDVLLRSKALVAVCHPFKVMGMNCIAIFVISDLLAIFLAAVGWGGPVYELLASALAPYLASPACENLASFLFSILFLLPNLLIAYILHIRRVYIRL